MAEERRAVIVLGDGTSIEVRSTVEQINSEIEGVAPDIPRIKVIDGDGAEHWINVNHIREVSQKPSYGSGAWQ